MFFRIIVGLSKRRHHYLISTGIDSKEIFSSLIPYFCLYLILYPLIFKYASGQVVPTHIRDIWLPKLRHTKFKFILSTCSTEASNVRRGIYSFSESEPEPNESQPGEEEKLLENVNRDYEGPYHILTPSFTHAVDPDIDLEGSDCHQKSNTILDGDDCIDIEYDAVPTTIKPSGAVCGKGIRIVQVVEGDITQSFYNISKLPTRSILKW